MTTRTLWHYTCEHGREGIGDDGHLVPAAHLLRDDDRRRAVLDDWWPASVVWLTDLRRPLRAALGLSNVAIQCDRLQHRYRVTDATGCLSYVEFRRHVLRSGLSVLALENVSGVRPRHWWVSTIPVPVVYDPVPLVVVR